ncbi:MAG: 2-phospho-L-lactate guanylyltransferase [Alphaproteobacteria bacterium]|nr:2-phospho-L-lactate guanylyltransferase [Alphaproteobacteria bacterium]
MTGSLAIVIPAKDPNSAKSRLAPLLSEEARQSLALTLFRVTLRFFRINFADAPLVVVTDSALLADEATHFDATILRDVASGLTAAVQQAADWCVTQGYASQLVIPSDIGALRYDEIARLFERPRPNPSLILCPSADEGGTNALLATPPNAVPIWYGIGSFKRFQAEAKARGIPTDVLRLANLSLDLDTPEDVRRFLDQGPDGPVLDELRKWATATSS